MQIEIETSGINLDLYGKFIDLAAVRAINRVSTTARTAALKHTRQDWNIKAGTLRKYTKIKRARRGDGTLVFSIRSEPVPLIEFAARSTKKGATYKVKRRVGRQLLKSGFIATMKSGHKGVFTRKSGARLPILEHKVITPTSMFDQGADKVFINTVNEKVVDRFRHELENLAR